MDAWTRNGAHINTRVATRLPQTSELSLTPSRLVVNRAGESTSNMALVNGTMVAIPPPDGYVVDFDNPQRNSVEAAYAVSAVGLTLATMFVGQRLYVKGALRGTLGLDDCMFRGLSSRMWCVG